MTISKILMTVGLLVVAGFSGVASAHTYSGSLGSAAGATDRWYVVCSNPRAATLTYQIQRTSRAKGTAAHVKVKFDTTGIISGPTLVLGLLQHSVRIQLRQHAQGLSSSLSAKRL